MKLYFSNLSILVILFFVFSCLENDDLVTEDAKEGGAIVSIKGTSGKVLGVPNAQTGEISFTDNDLSMNVDIISGGKSVEKYAIVKQYKSGEEVIVEEFAEVPHATSLSNLDEFLSGTGVNANNLRIGDSFIFRVKMTLKDGSAVYASPTSGQYKVVVNCSSNLAGTYTVTGVYNRPASGIAGQVVGPRVEKIVEISPGVYQTELTGHWSLADLGVSKCPIIFSDVCGQLTIEAQPLCDAYSNEVSGKGTVDGATGKLHFEYIVTGGNERNYTFDFVKKTD